MFFVSRYYYSFDPEQSSSGFFPSCPFHYLTGLHCPGCGSQRAIHDLLHGRFGEAFSHNALLLVLIIYILALSYYYLNYWFFNKKVFHLGHHKYFPKTVLCITVTYWICRNLPFSPFLNLAP
nr:DUF2752 domain-containing protein [Aquimarina brevivitae]